jgi:hypothetical protein
MFKLILEQYPTLEFISRFNGNSTKEVIRRMEGENIIFIILKNNGWNNIYKHSLYLIKLINVGDNMLICEYSTNYFNALKLFTGE